MALSSPPVDPARASTTDLTAQFDALVGPAPIAVYMVDADFRLCAANALAQPAFKGIPGGGIGRDFADVMHTLWKDEFAGEAVRRFRHTLATGEPYVAPLLIDERADLGVVESYEWRINRITLADGRLAVICYFRDMTDRMANENVARRLASIVESSDDAIISKNLDGTIVSWNRGAERVFGYTAAEAVGQSVLMLIPPDRHNEEPGIIERIRRGDRIDHYETIRRRKDGTLIDISLTVSPMRDANGHIIGASKIARDISIRKQADATRQLLVSELNHRVKNTLAVVQAIVQQTLWNTRDPADFAQRFSGRIQSLARVHTLLTDSTWQGADLRALIRDQLLHGSVDETKLTAWGPTVVLAPQTTLHVALMLHELGTNSSKHGALSATGGWVTVNWSVKDDTLHLKWEERGGPSVTVPIARGFGTRLIEQSAKSEGGRAEMICDAKGVTWEITLPLPVSVAGRSAAKTEAELVGSAPATQAVGSAEPRPVLAGRRILVIEDEPLIALGLVSSLELAGAEVERPVGTDKEALAAIERVNVDAALLDANLHGKPVGEIAAALTRRKIPFVFVTGYGRESLPEAFKHVTVLAKPFSDKQLLDAVIALAPSGDVVRLKA